MFQVTPMNAFNYLIMVSLLFYAAFKTQYVKAQDLIEKDIKPLLQFGYTEACPHMCPSDKNKGFTTDIARAIFEHEGYQVKFVDLPWARAAANTLNGQLDGVLSAGKEETPDLLFPTMEIALQSDCFYGKKSDSWVAGKAETFLNRKTIIFNGWVNEKLFQKTLGLKSYNASFEPFSLDQHYTQRVLNMIKLDRANAFWMDINVFAYYKRNKQSDVAGIKSLGCIKHQNLYLALSPKNKMLSAKLADQFDRGMKRLRSSSELDNILQKYGLNDWR